MTRTGSRALGAGLLGAELLASRELAEGAGSIWDTLERGSTIQRQQLQWLMSDYGGFFADLSAQPAPWRLPGAAARLLEQRASHINAGWQATGRLIRDELSPFCSAWRNFAAAIGGETTALSGKIRAPAEDQSRQP